MDTVELKPEFIEMAEEASEWIRRRITKEWDNHFGSMVLIAVPPGEEPSAGYACAFTHPREPLVPEHVYMKALFSLCMSALTTRIDAGDLLMMVMAAASEAGQATTIVLDGEGELDDMTQN